MCVSLSDASLEDLIKHVLHALKGASQKKLTSRNVSVGFVGADSEFRILEGEDIKKLVNEVTASDDEDEDEEKDKAARDAEQQQQREAEEKAKRDAEEEAQADQQAAQQMQE